MTNSRQSKIYENEIRFNRFLQEMDTIEDLMTDVLETIEINLNRYPDYVKQQENLIDYYDCMVDQLKSDATKWGLKMKKNMRLLEEIIGRCDLDYEWIFDQCDIQWLTVRFWQHCPENTLRETLAGRSAVIEWYPLPHQMTEATIRRAKIYRDKEKVGLILREVEDFEIALGEARKDLEKEHLNASQVQILEDEIAGLQSQLDDKQNRARQWGKGLGKVEGLIEDIAREYCEFEWIFELSDSD